MLCPSTHHSWLVVPTNHVVFEMLQWSEHFSLSQHMTIKLNQPGASNVLLLVIFFFFYFDENWCWQWVDSVTLVNSIKEHRRAFHSFFIFFLYIFFHYSWCGWRPKSVPKLQNCSRHETICNLTLEHIVTYIQVYVSYLCGIDNKTERGS